MNTKKLLHVYANSATDWYVAESVEEAVTLYRKENEKTGLDDSELDLEFLQCPDDMILNIRNDDQNKSERKVCAEWCFINGKGFLCTENF